MSLFVVAVAIALLTVPALAARSSMGPTARVRTACLTAVGGMGLLGFGTLLTASPLLLWWHDEGEVSRLGLRHLSPGGPLAWTASGLICGLGVSWIIGVARQSVAARRRASLPVWAAVSVLHDDGAGVEVRVAPSLEPLAFAVPGRDRHVVVSEAVTRLPDPERRAVLAHEGAHLRLGHHRHLLVLVAYERIWGWVPGVPAVVRTHRRSIEQWADADATHVPQVDRQAILQARARLGSCNAMPDKEPEASLGDLETGSSPRDLAAITVFVAGLLFAGAYTATHTVGDLTAAIAAIH